MHAAIRLSSGDALCAWSVRHAGLVQCNKQFLDLYRLPKRLGKAGTTFEAVLRGRVAGGAHVGDDKDAYIKERLDFINERVPASSVMMLNSGSWISVTHQPLSDGGWVSVHKDITEFNRLQEELAHRAYHDSLTDLPNRHMPTQRLGECVKEADGLGSFALLLLDLDGFKAINDTLGHAAGDSPAQGSSRAGWRWPSGTRGMPARMGGDEFAVVMDVGATARDAHMLAVQLIEAGHRPFSIEGQPCEIAFSIGIAVAPGDGHTAEQLLKNADLSALYAAKKDRRGSYCFFEPAMDKASATGGASNATSWWRSSAASLEMYYQPILNLKRQVICGFEALLRWNHPSRRHDFAGTLHPCCGRDRPLPIGEWALREA